MPQILYLAHPESCVIIGRVRLARTGTHTSSLLDETAGRTVFVLVHDAGLEIDLLTFLDVRLINLVRICGEGHSAVCEEIRCLIHGTILDVCFCIESCVVLEHAIITSENNALKTCAPCDVEVRLVIHHGNCSFFACRHFLIVVYGLNAVTLSIPFFV